MPQHALLRMLSPRNQSLVIWSAEWESDIDTMGPVPHDRRLKSPGTGDQDAGNFM